MRRRVVRVIRVLGFFGEDRRMGRFEMFFIGRMVEGV